jgi:hypothetical protein
MIKKALLALAISGTMLSAQASVVVNEGFEDISTLASSGWVLTNASKAAGSLGWFAGSNPDIFTAQAGTSLSYIASNFNNAPDGTINNWLITPVFSTAYGATVTFWMRGADDAGFFDQIAYGFSDGSSAITSFVMGDAITASTGTWTQVTATIAAAAGTARFAINYLGAGATSDLIGIDSFSINVNDATGDVPEPASLAILGAGLLGMGAARRRKNRATAA